jgi:hypothetical protein
MCVFGLNKTLIAAQGTTKAFTAFWLDLFSHSYRNNQNEGLFNFLQEGKKHLGLVGSPKTNIFWGP